MTIEKISVEKFTEEFNTWLSNLDHQVVVGEDYDEVLENAEDELNVSIKKLSAMPTKEIETILLKVSTMKSRFGIEKIVGLMVTELEDLLDEDDYEQITSNDEIPTLY